MSKETVMKVYVVTEEWWDDGCSECCSSPRHVVKVFSNKVDAESYVLDQKEKAFRIDYDIDEFEVN